MVYIAIHGKGENETERCCPGLNQGTCTWEVHVTTDMLLTQTQDTLFRFLLTSCICKKKAEIEKECPIKQEENANRKRESRDQVGGITVVACASHA